MMILPEIYFLHSVVAWWKTRKHKKLNNGWCRKSEWCGFPGAEDIDIEIVSVLFDRLNRLNEAQHEGPGVNFGRKNLHS